MSHAGFDLYRALDAFAEQYPQRGEEVRLFQAFLHSDAQVFHRTHVVGHFTGSAWIVSPSGDDTLLTLHAKLGRWLQLGGHADGDACLPAVALREAQEESGLDALEVEPAIFDIDRHLIPARGAEPAHWHYDVRFVIHARGDTRYVVSEESTALAWRGVRALIDDETLDPSLRRMAELWRVRTGGH